MGFLNNNDKDRGVSRLTFPGVSPEVAAEVARNDLQVIDIAEAVVDNAAPTTVIEERVAPVVPLHLVQGPMAQEQNYDQQAA